LLAARRGPARLAAASGAGLFATWFSDLEWRGVWPWWSILMVTLVAMLAIGWPERGSFAAEPGPGPGPDRADAGPVGVNGLGQAAQRVGS